QEAAEPALIAAHQCGFGEASPVRSMIGRSAIVFRSTRLFDSRSVWRLPRSRATTLHVLVHQSRDMYFIAACKQAAIRLMPNARRTAARESPQGRHRQDSGY